MPCFQYGDIHSRAEAGSYTNETMTFMKSHFKTIRKEYLKDWGRDPFIPYEEPKKISEVTKAQQQLKTRAVKGDSFPYEDYNLSAVIYDPQKPVAIINNSILYKGDYIKGAKIISIKPGQVILQKNKQNYTINVDKE